MDGASESVLVIGYGNPSRLDDGLGPALAAAVEARGLAGVRVDSNFQLTLEDAASVSEHDWVVFVDATRDGTDTHFFRELAPRPEGAVGTHTLDPETVLGLAHALFGSRARGFVLGIRGYEFDAFGEVLSARARENLDGALRFLVPMLEVWAFEGRG